MNFKQSYKVGTVAISNLQARGQGIGRLVVLLSPPLLFCDCLRYRTPTSPFLREQGQIKPENWEVLQAKFCTGFGMDRVQDPHRQKGHGGAVV